MSPTDAGTPKSNFWIWAGLIVWFLLVLFLPLLVVLPSAVTLSILVNLVFFRRRRRKGVRVETSLRRMVAVLGGFIVLLATLLPWATYSYYDEGISGSYVYLGMAFFGFSSLIVYLFGLFWLTFFALPRKLHAILGFGWGGLALLLTFLAIRGVLPGGPVAGLAVTFETGVYVSMLGSLILVVGSALAYLEAKKAGARGPVEFAEFSTRTTGSSARSQDRVDLRRIAQRGGADDRQVSEGLFSQPKVQPAGPMTTSSEELLGILPAARYGQTNYDLLVTDRRIIGAFLGDSGAAQLAGFVLGGVVGYAIGAALTHRQEAQRAKYFGLTVDQIVSSHKWNFQVALDLLGRAEFDGGINMITTPRLALWVGGQKRTFKFMHSYWRKNKAEVQYIRDVLTKFSPNRIRFTRV